jgi:hypothetical protein
MVANLLFLMVCPYGNPFPKLHGISWNLRNRISRVLANAGMFRTGLDAEVNYA